MSIKTKFAALAIAAVTATGSIVATTPAHAGGGGFNPGWAIGAGIVGAAVVGSAIAASQPYPHYYGYYHRCGFVRQFDAWGNPYLVRTCY